MDRRAGPVGERAGDHQAGKAAAGAEIDPDAGLGGEREKLQRVGDVPRPDRRDRRGRDQIGVLLLSDELFNELVEPRLRFT